MVTSANLDELVSRPLPDLEHQLELLMAWLSARLGDDPFQELPFPNAEHLAGVVGAVDGQRVDKLLTHAAKIGLIAFPHMGALEVTPEGLQMVRGSGTRTAGEMRETVQKTTAGRRGAEAMEEHDENQVVRANCNNCGGERNAFQRRVYFVRHDYDPAPVSSSDTFEILECCGCGEVSVRRTYWFSEWDDFDIDPITGEEILVPGTRTSLWPPASKRGMPEWADRIKDESLRTAMDEVYSALDHELVILAAIGTRTLLDRAMFLKVEDTPWGLRW